MGQQGSYPRRPIPDVAAAVLTERLGFTVTPSQLWPGRQADDAAASAAHNLGNVRTVDDFVVELTRLNTSPAPQSQVAAASGMDLTAAVLDQLQGAVVTARTRAGHEYVLPEQVALISTHVAALRRLDDRHGGGALSLRYVSAELRSVVELVDYANYSKAIGHQLLTIVADLSQLLGWLHFDSSRYGSAERYLLLSVGVGRSLGDVDRAANAIGMLSYVSAFAGHGSQAVQLAEAAANEAGRDNPILRARLLGREATAAAANGDLAQFRKRSDKAAELLRDSAVDAPAYLYYLAPEQLAAEAGQSLVVLAERGTASRDRLLVEAIAALQGSVSLLAKAKSSEVGPAYPRSALLHNTFLARAHLLRGDVAQGVETIRTGLGLLTHVQSPRGRNYLRLLRPALARRSRSAAVREFLPEFDRALSPV